jgi:hypothetical protein
VQIQQRAFDDFASQSNFGLTFVRTKWVFSVDADYVCPPELIGELRSLADTVSGYEYRFKYCINGYALRGSLYPPRVILFQAKCGRYVQDGHAHRLKVTGPVLRARTPVLHDDRKSLETWLESQAKYADLEVAKLLSARPEELNWNDRLRKRIVFAPLLTLVYCLVGKRLILDGWPGIFYTLQRVYAELLLSLKLLDAKLRGARESESRLESREPRAGIEQQVACGEGAQRSGQGGSERGAIEESRAGGR